MAFYGVGGGPAFGGTHASPDGVGTRTWNHQPRGIRSYTSEVRPAVVSNDGVVRTSGKPSCLWCTSSYGQRSIREMSSRGGS